ncbi:MAG: AMP-binding protein [Planctomycetota bacterium]
MGLIEQAIHRHARDRPDKVLLRLGDATVCYGQLPGLVDACARRLRRELPAPDPDHPVLLVGGSTPSFAVHLFALWHLGHGVLPLSERLPDAERRRVADQAGSRVTLEASNLPDIATDSGDEPLRLGGWLAMLASGTTGPAKIARKQMPAVDAVAHQVFASVGYRPDDIVYSGVPLTHAYGLEAGLLAPLLAGATVELENTFDTVQLGQRLHETRATIVPAVPAMIEMMVQIRRDASNESGSAFPHIRRLLCAGATLPESLWHTCRDTLGLDVCNYYGATEMGSVCLADPETPGHTARWLGQPMPGVTMSVVDPVTHEPLPDGQTGEIAVAAPSLMAGYLTQGGTIDQDAALIDRDGRRWFVTGDLGVRFEDGHFEFVARRKLLIEVGANKVNPYEVESILREHPAVKDAMVRGDRLNQTISRLTALIEPTVDEQPPSAAELRTHCREHLAPWKVPRTFRCQALPRSALGKVIRHRSTSPSPSLVGSSG